MNLVNPSGGALLVAATGVRASAAATDPNWANVILQLYNESYMDATTTVVDSKGAKAVTATGNAQNDTAQAPAGMTSSRLFDGVGDWDSLADNAAWDFVSSGDFSIEFPFRIAADASAERAFMGQANGTTLVPKWAVYHNESTTVGAGNLGFHVVSGGAGTNIVFGAWTPSLNTWYDMGFFRSGNNWYAFANGSQIGTTQVSAARPDVSTGDLRIGADGQNHRMLTGWMGPTRITTVCRQTGAYTPPTYPLPTA